MMQWQTLLRSERLYKKPEPQGRTQFERDYDRIVFSQSFRLLADKTQVHPTTHSKHAHNRLTHSIEVASIGRSLGYGVGHWLKKENLLPEPLTPQDISMIVQTACLAHDIGNPALGHVGEEIIQQAGLNYIQDKAQSLTDPQKQDIRFYNGNAAGFRLLNHNYSQEDHKGMNLTLPVLATFLKYPWTTQEAELHGGKSSCFSTETAALNDLQDGLEIPRGTRHPFSYLVESADDICYSILDLEDAFLMGLIPFEEISDLFYKIVSSETLKTLENKARSGQMNRKEILPLLRTKAMQSIIESCIRIFIDQHETLLNGKLEGELFDGHQAIKRFIQKAKKLARDKVYNDQQKFYIKDNFGILLQEKVIFHFSQAYQNSSPFSLPKIQNHWHMTAFDAITALTDTDLISSRS